MNRRRLLKSGLALFSLLVIAPMKALAAVWNGPAFEAVQVEQALQGLGIKQVETSDLITLIAPDFAENGAIVQIEVESHVPGTEEISILAEKNPTSLIANFILGTDTNPHIILRIKLGESGALKAVIKAGDKYYVATKHVEVAIGGCN
ncbi:MAG TPA: thiosulfate oxidation carrier protein SoxY [Methylophilaceae bacterium]|jgi:sulfur-oxidizing protein SoxY